MNYKIIIICAVVILAFSAVCMAGSDRRVGSAGAQELRIPVGSRGTALAGANCADVYGTDAIFYNPAGIAFTDGTEAQFSHLKYFADMDLNYFALTKSLEDFGSLGFSVKVLSVGDIVKTTETASTVNGTGEIFNPTMTVLSIAYSRIMTDRVSFGFTGKYINESIDLASASGIAFDFGVNYDTKWRGLKLGVVIKNVGPTMRFDGPGFERDVTAPGQNAAVSPDKTFRARATAFEIPSWVAISGAMDVYSEEKNRASFYGTFQSNNFSMDMIRAGVEYAFDEKYFVRGGYGYTMPVDKDDYSDGYEEDYLFGLTLGGGLTLSVGETDVVFEYSWCQTEFFDNNQYFTAKVNF